MKTAPIGIFDSGLGGLTVARRVAEMLPHEQILYVGDTERCPYGPRDLAEVKTYVAEICAFLAEKGVKLIIIACNTATAAGLADAQREFSIPIIGVVEPGARAAVHVTSNRKVGVIGTTGTIGSNVYSEAVRSLDAGVTVYSTATPLFVDFVEEGLIFDSVQSRTKTKDTETSQVYIKPEFYKIARNYLKPLRSYGIDTLILGCTHFPLLTTAIGQVMGDQVTLISSAEETARETAEILERRDEQAPVESIPNHVFYTTSAAESFEKLGSRIFSAVSDHVEPITVSNLKAAHTIFRAKL